MQPPSPPSSFTLSQLLEINKLLVKISQFELLVMTEKNIFAYKLFVSLNISKSCNPFEKSHFALSQQPL